MNIRTFFLLLGTPIPESKLGHTPPIVVNERNLQFYIDQKCRHDNLRLLSSPLISKQQKQDLCQACLKELQKQKIQNSTKFN